MEKKDLSLTSGRVEACCLFRKPRRGRWGEGSRRKERWEKRSRVCVSRKYIVPTTHAKVHTTAISVVGARNWLLPLRCDWAIYGLWWHRQEGKAVRYGRNMQGTTKLHLLFSSLFLLMVFDDYAVRCDK